MIVFVIGAIFCYSLFDKHWKPNMTEVEVKELAKLCLAEVRSFVFLFSVVKDKSPRIHTWFYLKLFRFRFAFKRELQRRS
jgi:hypothetical protein